MTKDIELVELETKLLLEAIFQHYGYDFRDYAPSSLKRRIEKYLNDEKLTTISSLQDRILHHSECLEEFLTTVTINVTEMFRDSQFYLCFRKKIVPLIKDLPFIRIWHAGCSTGEEVYSLAILLKEEGLYERSRLYATDINEKVIKKAGEGIYPLEKIKGYTENYLKSGGNNPFSEYYIAKYKNALFKQELKKNVVWASHNLASDASFNEFHIILCRNVLIYFNQQLQNKVHRLLYESLAMQGILCLGNKESIKFTPYEDCYEVVDGKQKIYRKVK